MQTIAREVVMEWKALLSRLESSRKSPRAWPNKKEEVLKTEASNSAIANALSRSGNEAHIEFLHLLTEDLRVPCFQPPEAKIVLPAFC
jgi:hypothetical protein